MAEEAKKDHPTWGGKRPGSGRKRLPPGVKRLKRQLYLTDDELEKVKAFIAIIRGKVNG